MARLKNEYEFIAGMHYDGELHFNQYKFTINFYANTDVIEDQNIAVERMHYFLKNLIQKGVFISEDEDEYIEKLQAADIPVFPLPAPGPFDPMVQAVLVHKLNAIIERALIIDKAELSSTLGGNIIYIWDYHDEEDDIHELVNEEDEAKWWVSSTPRYLSFPEGIDVEAEEEKNPFPLQWEMLNLGWYEEDDEDERFEFILDPSVKKSSSKKGSESKVIEYDFNKNKPKK